MMNRLLVIDQTSVLREELIIQLQSEGYEVEGCGDVQTAQASISENQYDLILLDPIFEPEKDYRLIEHIKQDENLKWIPVFILSKKISVEDKLRCFELGADDYVQKPFHYKELKAKIQSCLSRTSHFQEMAFKDPLTKAYNRRFFDHQIKVLLQFTQRNQSPISLAFIDADRFKSINDTYGHHVGDLVLIGLSGAIRKHMRSSDLVARFGGEEFVIAFPNISAQQAAARVNEILQYVRENPIAEHDGQQRFVTFSSGVAEWKPGMPIKNWIHLADEGVYQAKEEGRNRVIITQYKDDDTAHEAVKTHNVMILENNSEITSVIMNNQFPDIPIHIIDMGSDNNEDLIHHIASHSIDVFIVHDDGRSIEKVELLNRLKNISELSNLKTLFVTNISENILLHSLKMGIDDVLPLPFSEIDLEISLKRLLA